MAASASGHYRSMLICFGATSCALSAGFAISFSSVAMEDLQSEVETLLHLTKEQATWFGSLLPLMAMFGSLLSGPLMDKLGRKIALLCVASCFIISWIFMFLSTELTMLYVGRGMSGMATGMTTAVIPVYISEISPACQRGTMGGVFSVVLALGLPVGYMSGIWHDWRSVAEIGAALSCISFVICFMLPESYYWLLKERRTEEAVECLKRIRGKCHNVDEELREIQLIQKELHGHVSVNEILSRTFLKPLGIGVALMVFQQFSGVNAIFFYSHEIFRRAKFDDEAVASILVSSMQVLSILFVSFIVDRVGRRKLLLISALGMMVCHLLIGGCMFYILKGKNQNPADDEPLENVTSRTASSYTPLVSSAYQQSGVNTTFTSLPSGDLTGHVDEAELDVAVSWLCLVFVMMYITLYSIGMGPIPYIVLSEMLPQAGRGVAGGIGTMSNWLCAFILTKTFFKLVEIFAVYGVFWVFSSVCLCAAIFVWRVVPETSGKTLAEIQSIFVNRSKEEQYFTTGHKISTPPKGLNKPVSPLICSKSKRSSSVEEQTRDLMQPEESV